jgi:hypothetical protein
MLLKMKYYIYLIMQFYSDPTIQNFWVRPCPGGTR